MSELRKMKRSLVFFRSCVNMSAQRPDFVKEGEVVMTLEDHPSNSSWKHLCSVLTKRGIRYTFLSDLHRSSEVL